MSNERNEFFGKGKSAINRLYASDIEDHDNNDEVYEAKSNIISDQSGPQAALPLPPLPSNNNETEGNTYTSPGYHSETGTVTTITTSIPVSGSSSSSRNTREQTASAGAVANQSQIDRRSRKITSLNQEITGLDTRVAIANAELYASQEKLWEYKNNKNEKFITYKWNPISRSRRFAFAKSKEVKALKTNHEAAEKELRSAKYELMRAKTKLKQVKTISSTNKANQLLGVTDNDTGNPFSVQAHRAQRQDANIRHSGRGGNRVGIAPSKPEQEEDDYEAKSNVIEDGASDYSGSGSSEEDDYEAKSNVTEDGASDNYGSSASPDHPKEVTAVKMLITVDLNLFKPPTPTTTTTSNTYGSAATPAPSSQPTSSRATQAQNNASAQPVPNIMSARTSRTESFQDLKS